MKRILSSFNNKRSNSTLDAPSNYSEDSPESVILREVSAFCESASGPDNAQGTEFVHLPAIVESAESSPNAAREAAYRIRKLLSEPGATASNLQYNAIMLMRILIDNPGHTFTRNLDAKFVGVVKDLLRNGRNLNVQNFLRDTLEALESQRQWDEDLKLLLEMWKKEKTKIQRSQSGGLLSSRRTPSQSPQPRGLPPRADYNPPNLPAPEELAARISEARTTAGLLIQFVQTTPAAEILEHELIKEFSDRCRNASRHVQHYIHGTNPPPDEDTLATLIEANDELSLALSRHQRAILQARKALGQNSKSPSPSNDTAAASSAAARPVPPPPVPPREVQQVQGPPVLPPVAPTTTPQGFSTHEPTSNGMGTGRYEYRSEDFQVQNPFADNAGATADASGHHQPTHGPESWNGAYQHHEPVRREV